MIRRRLRCPHALLLLLLDFFTSASCAASPGSWQHHSVRILAPDGSVAHDDIPQGFAHHGSELRLQHSVVRRSPPGASWVQYMRQDPVQEPEHSGHHGHKHNQTQNQTTTYGPSSKTSGEKHAGIRHAKYGPPHAPAKAFFGLPPWSAMLIGGFWAALVVICANLFGAYMGSTLPAWASGEQKLKHQVEQAVEKVALLEIALKEKIEEEEKRAEEEARAAAGEEKKEELGPSYDELVGEMLYRTKDTQGKAIDAVNSSIRQAAPMLARASHIQKAFTDQMTGARERVTELGKQQAGAMYSRMKEAVGVDMDAADIAEMGAGMTGMEVPDWLTVNDDDVDPPPFALLLGGILAPMQLSGTKKNYTASIVSNSIMLATITACSVMDASRHCPDLVVWIWQYGMISLNGLDIMCNSFLVARCSSALGTLKEDEERMTHIRKTGNSVWDAYIALQSHSGQFFKAYFAYQGVVDSMVFTIQKVFSMIILGWGCLGIWITCENIVQDTLHCEAKIVLYFLHAYSFWFLLTLTWTVLGVIFWIIQKASNSVAVTGPILQYAKEWDEEIIFKLPLWQTITRGLILRDSSTMLRIKARQFAIDLEESTKQIQEDKLLFEKRRIALEDLSRKRESAMLAEQQIIDIYKEKLREQGEYVADDARPPGDDDDDRPDGGGASSSGSGGGGGASSSGGGGGASSSGGGGGASSSGGGGGPGSSGGGAGAGSSGGAGSAGAAGASSSGGFFGLDSASVNQQLTTVAAAGTQLSAADMMAASAGAQQGATDFFASAQAQASERGAGLAAGAQGFFTTAQQEAGAPGLMQGLTGQSFFSGAQGTASSAAQVTSSSSGAAPVEQAAATAAVPDPAARASLSTNPFAADVATPEPAATAAAGRASASSFSAAPVERASVTATAPEVATRASLPTAGPFAAEVVAPEPAASPSLAAAALDAAGSSTAPVTEPLAEVTPAAAEGGASASSSGAAPMEQAAAMATESEPAARASVPTVAPFAAQARAPEPAVSLAAEAAAPVTEPTADAVPAAAEGATASSSSSSAATPAVQGEAAAADEGIPGVQESW